MDLLLLLRDDFSKKTHFKGRQHLASSGISSIPQRCALTPSVPPVNCMIPVSPMLPGEVHFWYLLQSSIRNTTFSLGTLVPECLSTHESAPNHWPLFIYSEQLPTTLRQMKDPSYTKITDADLMISLGFEWGAQSASKQEVKETNTNRLKQQPTRTQTEPDSVFFEVQETQIIYNGWSSFDLCAIHLNFSVQLLNHAGHKVKGRRFPWLDGATSFFLLSLNSFYMNVMTASIQKCTSSCVSLSSLW